MTDPIRPQPDDLGDEDILPIAEPIGEGDSSILFEVPDLPPSAGSDDPFAHLPDPTSGASFATPWDQSVQEQRSEHQANQRLEFDSQSDQDLLRYAQTEVVDQIPTAEVIDDSAPIAELPPGSHGSSVVPLGGRPRSNDDDDVLRAEDILIVDEDLPPADEQPTYAEEVLPEAILTTDMDEDVMIVEDDTESAPIDEAPVPAPGNSSIIDILLGEELPGHHYLGSAQVSSEDPASQDVPIAPPVPQAKAAPADDDEDAFAYGHDAEVLIEQDGPTTGIKISDEIALSELDKGESASMTNLGKLPPPTVTDSHISKFVDEDWRASKPDLDDMNVSGSMVPLGTSSNSRSVIDLDIDVPTHENDELTAAELLDDGLITTNIDNIDLTQSVTANVDVDLSIAPEVDVDVDAEAEPAWEVEEEPAPAPAPAPTRNKWEERAAKKERKGSTAATEAAPTPSTSAPSKRGGGGTVVGTLLGLVLGAGGFAGAYFGGLLPPANNSVPVAIVPSPNNPNTNPPPNPIGNPNPNPPAPMATVDEGRKLLDLGNPAAALAAFDQLDANDEQVLLGKGQARWLIYLQEQAKSKAKLDGDAEAVLAAKDELTKVASKTDVENKEVPAKAKLWLGIIAETLGNFDEAKRIYQEGEESFSQFQQPFQAGLNRLELSLPDMPEKIGALPPHEALLGFVILLQDAAPMSIEEPGFKFWEALVFARRHQYGEARKALAASRDLHDRLRLEAPGKRINPTSDPLEQIYLRCCDELAAAWKVREGLYSNPMIAAQLKTKGIDLIVKDMTMQLDELAKQRKAADDLLMMLAADLKTAGFDEPKVADALSKIIAAQKKADDQLKDIAKQLKDGGIDEADTTKAILLALGGRKNLADMLGAVTERLVAAKVVDGDVNREKLIEGMEALLAKASTPGIGELVPPGFGLLAGASAPAADSLQVATKLGKALTELKATQDALAKAKTTFQTEMAALMKRQEMELDALIKRQEQQLANVRTPAKTLDLWLVILSNPNRKGEIPAATADADSILKDDKAAPDAKAKALAITGLAARNSGEYANARKTLESVLTHPGFDANSAWAKDIAASVDELRNPGKIVRADAPPTAPKEALVAIDQMLQLYPADKFPKENAQLLVKRAEQRLLAGELIAAKVDAEAAIQAKAGIDGLFVLARIAEKMEDFALAEKSYREVVKSPNVDPTILKEARFGLARSIIEQRRPSRLLGPISMGGTRPEVMPELATTLLLVMLQPGPEAEQPKPQPGQEALQLAEELLASGDKRGHFLKADVLLQRERYTEALQEYSAGIRAGATPTEAQRGLLDEIIARHPNLKLPLPNDVAAQEAAAKAARNPAQALREFTKGCTDFHANRFAEAEQAFARAVGLDNQDARYVYFLGLARWMQGNTLLAENDFQVAAALEAQGKPNRRIVNQSLERIQGEVRTTINRYRP